MPEFSVETTLVLHTEILERVEQKVDTMNATVIKHDRWIYKMIGGLAVIGFIVMAIVGVWFKG